MNRNLGLQLYSLREQLSVNFEKTLEKVALAGYDGVELAGLYNQKTEHVAKLLQDLNLKLVAMHCNVLTDEDLKQSLREAEALNCENLICPWVVPDTFASENGIRLFAEKLNNVNQQIKAQGKNLLYHNHDFEFKSINGECAFDLFAAQLAADVCFELDAYLAAVGGADSFEILRNYPTRIKMLHIKDGLISPPTPNTAIGDGNMNYTAIVASLPPDTNWLFVELQVCATDMLEAVQKSAGYCRGLVR